MDKYLDARFERVEKALAVLIDSIAKYNPSEKLAEDLVAADKELAKGLQELERHQNNHARIQQLREETSALDAQTKDTIGALWNMRKEVKNTQTTLYPPSGPKYHFTTAELLDYARRISRNTLPPPGVTNGVDLAGTTSATPTGTGADLDAAQTPNTSFNGGGGGGGTVANTPATNAAPPTPLPNGTTATTSFDQSHSQATLASTTTGPASQMPDHLKPFTDLLSGAVFYPWPTEENIRRGALAAYQQLVDNGIDPRGYDPEEEKRRREAEEQARKDAEEAARLEREEADRRMRAERERMARERERERVAEMERQGSGAVGMGGGEGSQRSPVVQAKKQFAFLGGDDEDDDDDDE